MRGVDVRQCVVLDINDGTAECVDLETATPFAVPVSAPGGISPLPGDQWLLDKMGGYWSFARCIVRAPMNASPVRTFPEMIHRLVERGLVDTSFLDRGVSPTGALIGEVRWFHTNVTPDPYYWVQANGGVVSREEYRELGRVLSPGISATYTATSVTGVAGPVVPHYCAR